VEELVEGGIRDVRLELRAGCPQQPDPAVTGASGGKAQQGRLSNAWVARQQERVPCPLGDPAYEQL
jgi:hypothetical protein